METKGIEPLPSACKAEMLPLSLSPHTGEGRAHVASPRCPNRNRTCGLNLRRVALSLLSYRAKMIVGVWVEQTTVPLALLCDSRPNDQDRDIGFEPMPSGWKPEVLPLTPISEAPGVYSSAYADISSRLWEPGRERWQQVESNHRHRAFQTPALPTELCRQRGRE